MPERTSWLSVGLAVAIGAGAVAVVRLGGLPSVGGEPPVPSLVASPAPGSDDASLATRVLRIEADLKRIRRELSSLRRDHEALSGWTLQSLLSAQSGGGPVVPSASQVEETFSSSAAAGEADEPSAAEDGFEAFVAGLELFPQQVAAVRPLVVEYVTLRAAGDSSGAASAGLAAELRERLVALLTDEQTRRLDQMVDGASRAPSGVATSTPGP